MVAAIHCRFFRHTLGTDSVSSTPFSLVMIVPDVVAPRYMGSAIMPRRALLGTTLPHRNSHQTYALVPRFTDGN